jgi:hypothetical protein
LSFTESAPNTADGQLTTAISTALITIKAAADFRTAVQAPILVPGLVSTVFRI